VRDAKFAGWGLNRPAQPMFHVPLAQNVDYKNEMMRKLELRSHFSARRARSISPMSALRSE